jgi:hypothetical protein
MINAMQLPASTYNMDQMAVLPNECTKYQAKQTTDPNYFIAYDILTMSRYLRRICAAS